MLWSSVLLLFFGLIPALRITEAKIVCYYDGSSYFREGVAKVDNLTAAALQCDQLIYGYYRINSLFKVVTDFDYPYQSGINVGTDLKKINPQLKVLLSLGGNVESKQTDRFLRVLETPESRTKFANNLLEKITEYNYDGADLAWQWPEVFDEKDKEFMEGGLIPTIKDIFSFIKIREEPSVYAEAFSAFVRELKAVFRPSGHIISISILPHVNATEYVQIESLRNLTDQFILHTYDYRSPHYFPKLVDYSAPLHFVNASHRQPANSVEATVQSWLAAGIPSEKLIISIPTFGRSWAIEKVNLVKGTEPPMVQLPDKAIGAAKPSSHTKTKGLMAYYEICPHLVNFTAKNDGQPSILFKRIPDETKRLGAFCVRAPGLEIGVGVSFEEPETAMIKAAFVKEKKLGGVAVVDLSLDDFQGMCAGNPFPILEAVRKSLRMETKQVV